MFSILTVKHERMDVKMKKLMTMVLGLMCAVGMAGMAMAGNIDSPGPPSAGSGMYSLKQLYDYLNAGTTATIPGSFQEPSAGPASTMYNTKQIYEAVATPFPQCNAAVADVKSGVKFFSTVAGSWGVKTGTLVPGSQYCTVLKTGQTATYYTGDDGFYKKGKAFSLSTGGDSTVIDNVTGLQWQAGTEPGAKAWSDAIDWAEGLVQDSKSDWRLPNITELQTLLVRNANQTKPYINKTVFPNAREGYYWASTTGPWSTPRGMLAAFDLGGAFDSSKNTIYNVRAVRGGE